jgi:hypothetical protein
MINLLIVILLLGFGAYLLKKKFGNNPDDSQRCVHCGNRLMKNPTGSVFTGDELICSVHGADCRGGS